MLRGNDAHVSSGSFGNSPLPLDRPSCTSTARVRCRVSLCSPWRDVEKDIESYAAYSVLLYSMLNGTGFLSEGKKISNFVDILFLNIVVAL